MLVAVVFGSLVLSTPRYFEYQVAQQTINGTQPVLNISKNENLFGNRVYVIGYRIVNYREAKTQEKVSHLVSIRTDTVYPV